MNPGKLDRRVEILAPLVTASKAGGGAEQSFSVAATVWGARADQGGREYREFGALNAEATSVFTLRWREGLTTRNRLCCEGKEYDIRNISETGGRHVFLLVQAQVRS